MVCSPQIEPAEEADLGVVHTVGAPVSFRPHELFCASRSELSVFSEDAAFAVEENQGVVDALVVPFVHTDDHICGTRLGRPAQRLGRLSRNIHGVSEEFGREGHPLRHAQMPGPVRTPGDKDLGQNDQFGTVCARLLDQVTSLFHTLFPVQENGACLHRSRLELRVFVPHFLPPSKKAFSEMFFDHHVDPEKREVLRSRKRDPNRKLALFGRRAQLHAVRPRISYENNSVPL